MSQSDIEWHFIGPIQTNKTRPIAERFQWVHSVDRFKDGKEDVFDLYDTVISLSPGREADCVPRALYQMNIGSVMIGFQFLWNLVRRLPEERRDAFRSVFCERGQLLLPFFI